MSADGALRGERLDRLEAAVLGGGRDLLAPTARKSYLSSPFLRLGRRERSEPGSTGRLRSHYLQIDLDLCD